ncbi:PAS domain-containing protein [Lysinibacillus sp. MHQ-1]|nr:PAS domain-containing protein [Lysinibacillus sp. MHQ-1]
MNLFCSLTNASRSQILKTNYFTWLLDEKKDNHKKRLKKKIHNGIMVQAKLHHKGIDKPPFWAEIQALPFRNDANVTQYVLVLMKDVTYYHTEDFLMRLENDMYKAIERDSSFEQKMHIICRGLDEFFMPNTSSMVLIKTESNLLQTFMDNGRSKDVPRCCENTDFFYEGYAIRNLYFY